MPQIPHTHYEPGEYILLTQRDATAPAIVKRSCIRYIFAGRDNTSLVVLEGEDDVRLRTSRSVEDLYKELTGLPMLYDRHGYAIPITDVMRLAQESLQADRFLADPLRQPAPSI